MTADHVRFALELCSLRFERGVSCVSVGDREVEDRVVLPLRLSRKRQVPSQSKKVSLPNMRTVATREGDSTHVPLSDYAASSDVGIIAEREGGRPGFSDRILLVRELFS